MLKQCIILPFAYPLLQASLHHIPGHHILTVLSFETAFTTGGQWKTSSKMIHLQKGKEMKKKIKRLCCSFGSFYAAFVELCRKVRATL